MLHRRWGCSLLGWLLPSLCIASTLEIDPRGESLYQQALPYLEKANRQLEAVPGFLPRASASQQERGKALLKAAGGQFRSAIALLEPAAELDHPVAQYRLALIYVQTQSTDEVDEQVCPLLKKSLDHGFAPASVMYSTWCRAQLDPVQFQQSMHAVEREMPLYERYFPQPVVRLECKAERPEGMALQWGSSRDYQAEIYRMLGAADRPQRVMYYQKAIDINGCDAAKKRMPSSPS